MKWQTDIPMSDTGWREISLSSKHPEGANVRFSPVADTYNNIAGRILHETINGKIKGLANPDKAYKDDKYTWYPIVVLGSGLDHEPYLWAAIDVFHYELGAFVNVGVPESPVEEPPLFYDLPFGQHGTIRITEADRNFVVAVLHALATFTGVFRAASSRMSVAAETIHALADFLGSMEGVQ